MIPKIIHQSWKTTDLSSYGPSAKKSQDSWLEFYPDFEYKFWTDKDIADYMEKQPPEYKQAFGDLDANIKKMDFFRYLILHEYGGIYSDVDFIANKRIDQSTLSNHSFIGYKACRNGCDLYLEEGGSGDKSYTITDDDGSWVLGQAFFGCERGHKGIHGIIKDIISNKKLRADPLLHTGPEKINQIFIDNNLLNCDSTFIFSKKEVGNSRGTIGFHLRGHRW